MANVAEKKDMVRFTAWLHVSEKRGIDLIAEQHNTSANYVLRNMIRAALEKPYSAELLKPK